MENMAKQQTLVWTFSIGLVGNAGFLYFCQRAFAFKVTVADLSEAPIFSYVRSHVFPHVHNFSFFWVRLSSETAKKQKREIAKNLEPNEKS